MVLCHHAARHHLGIAGRESERERPHDLIAIGVIGWHHRGHLRQRPHHDEVVGRTRIMRIDPAAGVPTFSELPGYDADAGLVYGGFKILRFVSHFVQCGEQEHAEAVVVPIRAEGLQGRPLRCLTG